MSQAALKTTGAARTLLVSVNPADPNDVLGEVPVSSASDITAAVAAARAAQPSWAALGIEGRITILRKVHAYIQSHAEEFAQMEMREMGRPITASRTSVTAGLTRMQWSLDNGVQALAPETTFEDATSLHQVWYEPWGVFAVISPWNNPLGNFMSGALQPLVAGNTVVYKTSEETPVCAQLLDKAFRESGLPNGVLTFVYGAGDVGEQLARADINFLVFTGSTKTGQHLYRIAAEKFLPVKMELGGSSGGVLFEDADVDGLLDAIFQARFANSGQVCWALKRLFVHQSRYDEVITKLTKLIQSKKVGNPCENDSAIGCLVAPRQQQLLAEQVSDALAKGAKAMVGGHVDDPEAAYYPATILTGVTKAMRAYTEELFGPVLSVWPFTSEDEAINLANDTDYGLSAYIYTQDKERAKRVAGKLQAGLISHNGVSYANPNNPLGGYKLSGLGRVGGSHGLRQCCQIKTVAMKK